MTQNTPPAAPEGNFDVRDEIATLACIANRHDSGGPQCEADYDFADAFLARYGVRPHGTATPPAAPEGNFDVREAMHAAVSDVLADAFSDAVTERIAADILTRMSVTHEVRPRGAVPAGQVSDAEVETVLQALGHSRSGVTTSRMRTTLEAAREDR